MRNGFFSVLVILLAVVSMAAAMADGRYALVVGNSAYKGAASLANPGNDASAMAEALDGLGFETTLLLDATGNETVTRFAAFNRQSQGAEIALFYFAGHGVQVGAQSFLLPTDVATDSEETLRFSAIDAGWIVSEMEKRAEVSLVILDACRDNPFPELLRSGSRSVGISRGLGLIPLSGKGAIVAYAAAAGRVADDGESSHSPYTEALLAEIDAPGVEVGLMLRRVAGRVIEKTGGTQRPELLVRLIEEVYLNPAPASGDVAAEAATPAPAPEPGGGAGAAVTETPEPAAPSETFAPVEIADAGGTVGMGGSADRRLFGDQPIKPPAWVEGLRVPDPSGWASGAAVAIADPSPGRGFAAARPLPLAVRVETRIGERGQQAWYRVEVPLAGEITVSIAAPPAELDVIARVYNADRVVAADWQVPTGPGAPLDAVFPVGLGGSYWIELRDNRDDAASAETFTVEVDFRPADDPYEPNPSIGRFRPVTVDASLRPTIFPRGDSDWLSFFVDRPGLFSAAATEVPATLDVIMRVRNYSGDVVRDWVSPPRAGGDTYLEAELRVPGQYFLEVRDNRDDAAAVETFALALGFQPIDDTMEPNDSFGRAAPQPATGRHRVAIFPRGDRDWIVIRVDQPGTLDLAATGVPDNLDVIIRVLNSEKGVLRDWFSPPRPGGDTLGFADLPSPGLYYVEVGDNRDDASSATAFDLALTYTEQPDPYEPNNSYTDARPLTMGGEILFNILPRGDRDMFRIEAPSAGELTAIIDPSPANLDLHYRFYNAERAVIQDWVPPYRKGGVTEGFVDLPAAGTYFLEIMDGRDDDRAIEHAVLKTTFRAAPDPLEPNNSFGAAAPLAVGTAHAGHILPRGDVDWYRIEVDRAGTLSVSIEDVDPALDIGFRALNADGAVIVDWIVPPRAGAPVYGDIPVGTPGTIWLTVMDMRSDARAAAAYVITTELK